MEDIRQMQREAERRVRRMQEHTRRVFEEHRRDSDGPLRSPGLYAPAPEPPEPRPPRPAASRRLPAEQPPRGLDAEQLLLLGLALLLLQSGCRPELAVALLYIAM